MLAGRLSSGAIISFVVSVRAVEYDCKASLIGQSAEFRVEFRLAVVAAIRGIRGVIRVFKFFSEQNQMTDAESRDESFDHLALKSRIRGAVARNRERPLSKLKVCDVGQI